jgi:hypothetical protein
MVRLILFILKQLWSATKYATPFAVGLFFYVGGVSFRLSIPAVSSMVKGIDKMSDIVAGDWTRRSVNAGFPNIWQVQLYSFFFVLSFCTILAGWFVLGFTVAFIVYLAF